MEYSKLPDLTSLATLKEVVERGGVNEAAGLLNVGQPAVTKRLRALDAIYDAHLMERVGGRLQLTEAGRQVYQYAVQAIESHGALEKSLADHKLGKRTLRLEVTMAIGEHFLSEWLVNFADSHPEYRVESRLAYGRVIEPHLATGQVDLAVLENAPDHPDILVQQWRQDEIVLVCGANHSIAGQEQLLKEDLSALTYVLREKNAAIREHMDKALAAEGLQDLNISMEVGSTAAIIDILLRGRHVSFLPWFAIASHVQAGSLVYIPVSHFRILRILWIARNRMYLRHPVAEAFIDMLRA